MFVGGVHLSPASSLALLPSPSVAVAKVATVEMEDTLPWRSWRPGDFVTFVLFGDGCWAVPAIRDHGGRAFGLSGVVGGMRAAAFATVVAHAC